MFELAPADRTMRYAVPAALVIMALAVGCAPGEDPQVARARAVLQEYAAADPEYERYAMTITGESDSPDALAIALAGVGAENFQTALVAVDALGEEPAVEATEALRQVFQSKSGALKRSAAVQLARLGDAEAVEYLKGQLSDPMQPLSIPAVTSAGLAMAFMINANHFQITYYTFFIILCLVISEFFVARKKCFR